MTKERWSTTEAFMSGLGLGAILGAIGMLLLVIYLLENNGIRALRLF